MSDELNANDESVAAAIIGKKNDEMRGKQADDAETVQIDNTPEDGQKNAGNNETESETRANAAASDFGKVITTIKGHPTLGDIPIIQKEDGTIIIPEKEGMTEEHKEELRQAIEEVTAPASSIYKKQHDLNRQRESLEETSETLRMNYEKQVADARKENEQLQQRIRELQAEQKSTSAQTATSSATAIAMERLGVKTDDEFNDMYNENPRIITAELLKAQTEVNTQLMQSMLTEKAGELEKNAADIRVNDSVIAMGYNPQKVRAWCINNGVQYAEKGVKLYANLNPINKESDWRKDIARIRSANGVKFVPQNRVKMPEKIDARTQAIVNDKLKVLAADRSGRG